MNVVGSDGRARGSYQFTKLIEQVDGVTGDHEVHRRLETAYEEQEKQPAKSIGETVSFQKSAALQFPCNGSPYEYRQDDIY